MSVAGPRDRTGRLAGIRVTRPGERRSLSRSATRALDLLEYFGEVRRPLRAVEIARQLGMHPSTTDQLLKTLVGSSHLQFDARTRAYRPSPRLLGFGGWLVETYGPGDRLRLAVRELSAVTGLVATLTTPHDLSMQVIDMARPPGLRGERGQRVSIFGSATGSAYLAALPQAEVARLAERARVPDAELAGILTALDDIRRDGCADGPTGGSAESGAMGSIAVAIAGAGLPFPAVLGLAGPARRVRDERGALRDRLHEAVGRLRAPDAAP